MLYAVTATRTVQKSDGSSTTRQLPMFFLDSTVQGIVDHAHAWYVAADILPSDAEVVYDITVAEVPPAPSPLPAWLCPVLVGEGYTGARHSPHSRRPWECRVCGEQAPEGTSWHFNTEGVQL